MSRSDHFGQGASEHDYRMRHTAPDDTDAPMHDIERVMPNFYDHPEWYHHGGREYRAQDRAGSQIIQGARGNPDHLITVYRAVPHHVTDINPGDWVTQTRSYAEGHQALHQDTDEYQGKPGRILSRQVRAAELHNEGNSMHEWGWNPR